MPDPSRPFRQHFLEPRRTGGLPDAQRSGEAENTACGDWVRFHLRHNGGCIEAVSVQVRGCSATIACASLTAEALEGLELDSARVLDIVRLAEEAGATRRDLTHAPYLVARAVQAALAGGGLDCQAS